MFRDLVDKEYISGGGFRALYGLDQCEMMFVIMGMSAANASDHDLWVLSAVEVDCWHCTARCRISEDRRR